MSQSKNLFQIVQFFIRSNFGSGSIPDVGELTAKWKYPKPISSNNRKPSNSKRLGRVPLGQNKGTQVRLFGSSPVGIVELGNPRNRTPLHPIILFQLLDSLSSEDTREAIPDAIIKQILDEFWF